jgi:preprotein translocase subunit SecF
MRILANTNFNFIRWRWHAIVLSIAVIATGVVTMRTRGGLALGVDFTGGTLVQLQFAKPTGEEVVRNALQGLGDVSVQRVGAAGENQLMVRLPLQSGSEGTTNLDADAKRVDEALRAANVGEFTPVGRDLVGPTIGRDLRRKGILATAASLVGIMAYIAFRFRLSFGLGAMVASIHDVLVTLSLLVLFKYELTLNVVAAILTLTGYGVNDQIVVFDRVRENLRKSRQEPMDSVINKSVNQTLPRTIITAGVTFLAVLALYLFGGSVLEGFAFAMLVGILTSTYSTVYIASAVAVVLSGRRGGGSSGETLTQAQAKARRRA